MKKLLFGLFTIASLHTFAQKWETVKGNGQVKKETREVSAFSSLLSRGSMNVEISYGNSNKITVEADENLLPYIETTVADGKLTIKTKKNINIKTNSKMVVYVTMNKINSLQLSGSGNITGKGAFTNPGKTDIGISGSGNINLSFDSFGDLDLAISGSGNMNLKGSATNNILAAVSGSGNIESADISSNNVDARISGSGNIKVYASRSIDAKISGSGNVYYKGNASISSKTAGSGKVIKI
jgi:hypothetical protein